MTQSLSRPSPEHNLPSQTPIVDILSFGLLENTTYCSPSGCSLCSSLPRYLAWGHIEAKALGQGTVDDLVCLVPSLYSYPGGNRSAPIQ